MSRNVFVVVAIVMVLSMAACGSALGRLDAPASQLQWPGHLERKVKPISRETKSTNPIVTVIDPRRHVLTVLPPRDGTTDRRIFITAPGLPFTEGTIELQVSKVDVPDENSHFQEVFTYLTTEETENLFLDLPESLPSGKYKLETRLILYGAVEGTQPGRIERVREQTFFRGETATAPVTLPESFKFTIAEYDVGHIELLPAQQKLLEDKTLQDLKTANVTGIRVRGHTCDLGTRDVNYVMSIERARAVIVEMRRRGLVPPNVEPTAEAAWDDEWVNGTKPAPGSNTAEDNRLRRINRRVEVIIEYLP